jgi:hypothetical protein
MTPAEELRAAAGGLSPARADWTAALATARAITGSTP